MIRVGCSVRWRSAGAALTFLLAAAAGVAGNRLTGRMDAALGAFAVLAAAGMLVTYVLDRKADARAGADDRDRADGEVRPPVDLRAARGVQVGDGNFQQNYFGHRPGCGSS
jgi:hypothetical protein